MQFTVIKEFVYQESPMISLLYLLTFGLIGTIMFSVSIIHKVLILEYFHYVSVSKVLDLWICV